MVVTRARTLRLAALAELQVDESEVAELEAQIARILGFVAQVGALPPSDEPADDRTVRLRRDEPAAAPLGVPPEDFAPAFRDGYFTVPRLADPDRGPDP
jgi:aspartyl/glutamyl-tRNA(Asn/Gln) amidotransferase C subunit